MTHVEEFNSAVSKAKQIKDNILVKMLSKIQNYKISILSHD